MNELNILYWKNLSQIPMLKPSKCEQAITGHSNTGRLNVLAKMKSTYAKIGILLFILAYA